MINKSKGSNSFNALRFVFCVIVIIGHSLDISHTEWLFRNWIDMHISVCGFFILSGYWVTKSYLKNKNPKSFYTKRFLKIFPLYLITVLSCAILLVFFSTLSPKDYFCNPLFWKYVFWNCITLNFIAPSLPGVFGGNPINGALWTIKVELGFYLILPLLVYILDKLSTRRRQNIFLCVIYGLSVLWNILLLVFAPLFGLPTQLAHQLPGFMSFFVSGMMYVYNTTELEKTDKFLLVPAVILFILHYVTKTEILLPFALTIIIMFLGKSWSFFSEIGQPIDYTYGMYLFHFPIINIFAYFGFFTATPVFSILVIIFCVLGMSYVTEKYIQQKINRLIQ